MEAETAGVGGVGGGCCGNVRLHAEQPKQLSSLLVFSWVVVMSSSNMLAKPKFSQNSLLSQMEVSSALLLSDSSLKLLLSELLLPESSSASFSLLSSIFLA